MFGLKMGELLILALVLGCLVVPVLFLLTWARTLRLTRSHHTTPPGLVWLMLIPVFNLGWQFYLLRAATRGIKGRLAELGRDAGDGGFGAGVTYQGLVCSSTLLSLAQRVVDSDLSRLIQGVSLAAFVTWLIYWVRISRFNREIAAPDSPARPTAVAG